MHNTTLKQNPHKPMVLIILDGWGHRDATAHNAIAQAKTPNWDHFCQKYPHLLIAGSGSNVGLPEGQMGNSEVGHLNIGAGRVIFQEFTRICHAIADGSFFSNPTFCQAVDEIISNHKALHIIGLLSPGGVHSHEQQIHALLKLACMRGARKVYVHAILDGRDTPPKSSLASLKNLGIKAAEYGCGQIASIMGRYYAMDRDHRWERTQRAYDTIAHGRSDFHATLATEALEAAYERGETDEFIQPTTIFGNGDYPIAINEGDAVVFMNYRADRARQLSHAFVDDNFNAFDRGEKIKLANFITLTQYAAHLNANAAFAPERPTNVLGEYIANLGLHQLRIAETEKYAHVTFFFNGGIETPFKNEQRILIPSAKVSTYDLKPEMSAYEITEKLVTATNSRLFDLIICNFANPDMVGHTGNFSATIKAIETVDACIGRIIYSLQKIGGEAMITADHGNAELMFDDNTQQPHTAHTHELVPIIYIGRPAHVCSQNGTLCDVAPSLLRLMGLNQPPEMTGKPLFALDYVNY